MFARERNRFRAWDDWPPINHLSIDVWSWLENDLQRTRNLGGWLALLSGWNLELFEEVLPVDEIRLADGDKQWVVRFVTGDLIATSSPDVDGVDTSVRELHPRELREDVRL